MKKTTLKKLFNSTKDCYGWAWHVGNHKYVFQNDNDLGLLAEELVNDCYETVIRKEQVCKGKYLYILRNNWKLENDDSSATLVTIKALLKEIHDVKLTKHEQMLVERYWDRF